MRVSTVATCALAVLAVQDWNHQAVASQDVSVPLAETAVENAVALEKVEAPKAVVAIAPPESVTAKPIDSDAFADQPIALSNNLSPEQTSPEQTPSEQISSEQPAAAEEPQLSKPAVAETISDSEIEPVPPDSMRVVNVQQVEPEETQAIVTTSVRPERFDNPMVMAQAPTQPLRIPTSTSAPTRVSIEGQELPVPGVLPLGFTFPIHLEIVTNSSITTDTSITDQEFPDPLPRANVDTLEQLARYREARTVAINVWSEQIRDCLQEYPQLVSIKPDGTQIPVLFSGNRGTIVKNANGQLVCPV